MYYRSYSKLEAGPEVGSIVSGSKLVALTTTRDPFIVSHSEILPLRWSHIFRSHSQQMTLFEYDLTLF